MDIRGDKGEEIKKKTLEKYMKAYLTVSEAARYLSVCRKTIRRWDMEGKITCACTTDNHRCIAIIEIKRGMGRKEIAAVIPCKKTAVY
ncbi:MAG: helix-turn-helix domain-containing protein [Candidatus Hodarchaeales archaeon]